mmetsp:Transcript_1765/g.5836  ORF Transcript_1765/g.5836 Transcript_1765/m.5836 type:complete len:229 (+) Transcript_1765:1050-1736(+)
MAAPQLSSKSRSKSMGKLSLRLSSAAGPASGGTAVAALTAAAAAAGGWGCGWGTLPGGADCSSNSGLRVAAPALSGVALAETAAGTGRGSGLFGVGGVGGSSGRGLATGFATATAGFARRASLFGARLVPGFTAGVDDGSRPSGIHPPAASRRARPVSPSTGSSASPQHCRKASSSHSAVLAASHSSKPCQPLPRGAMRSRRRPAASSSSRLLCAQRQNELVCLPSFA